ncbi:MAG: hypothetical protein U0269_33125 [Polyangiales bacterium]
MNRWAQWLCALCAACVLSLVSMTASAQQRGRRPAQVCVPGAQTACACMGGASGVQRCNPRGTALLSCECPEARADESANTPAAQRAVADESSRTVASAPSRTSAINPASFERRWYGWQILIPDLAGGLLTSIGGIVGGTGGLALSITGSTVAFFGGPIVHWAHGHVGRGFASMFGLRLGLPVAGALLGLGIGYGAGNPSLGTALGASVGALTGLIVDIAVLAYDEPAVNVRVSRSAPRIAPYAVVAPYDSQRGAALVGLQGRF